MPRFTGREEELKKLINLSAKKSASFIVVKGRRRIGKSRLIEEFSKQFESAYFFSGLPPEEKTTQQSQLDEFSRQLTRQFKTAAAKYEDWSDVLWALGERVQTGKLLLFFDEISWMASKDSDFLGKIKNCWDQQLKQNDQLLFVVCGSASSWIEKNLLSSTGFVGRISYTLTLEELPLSDCSLFWPKNIAAFEKYKLLSVTGGVPKYLEEMNPKQSAEENIRQLCFSKGGFLVNEFDQIFADLFLRDSPFYKKLVIALASGPKELNEICALLGLEKHGRVPEYLWELELAGFIARDYTWSIQTAKSAALSHYRLKDNYLRFYIKYIAPNRDQIERNAFAMKSLTALPEWPSIMGFQFENLVLNNRRVIQHLIGIAPEDVVFDNPFFQRKTVRAAGCQIDYMIQTKFNVLYICEIKFSKNEIESSVMGEVQKKIDTLKYPKGYSCRPVLIHVNGVSENIVDSDYFAAVIDFGELLQGTE